MPNRIFLDKDDLIIEIIEGDQNADTIGLAASQIEGFMKQLKKKSKPVDILVDLQKVGREDMGARKVGWEVMKKWEYHKIAMFGANQYMRHVVNLVITATGRGETIRHFDTEEHARAWLKE